MLCNYYVSKLSTPPYTLKIISYADDCTITSTAGDIQKLEEENINEYLPGLHYFLAQRNLQLPATKSSATIFTTLKEEVARELNININGQVIPTVKHPKLLGVTFDSLYMFAKHTESIVKHVKKQ